MPRRANATSFGGKAGNPRNTTKPGTGRPPDVFRNRMQLLALRAAQAKRLEKLLSDKNPDDHTFLKAFSEVSDRGFGKAPQSVDVTSDGEKIQSLLVVPPEIEP